MTRPDEIPEEYHDYQGREVGRLTDDIDAMIWFGKWAWRVFVAASVVALALAFWQAWGAQ